LLPGTPARQDLAAMSRPEQRQPDAQARAARLIPLAHTAAARIAAPPGG
jgi:hypothetical protein